MIKDLPDRDHMLKYKHKNKNFRTDPEGMTEGKGGNQITEKRQIS